MQRTLNVTITFVINPLSKASKVMKDGLCIWLKSRPALKKKQNKTGTDSGVLFYMNVNISNGIHLHYLDPKIHTDQAEHYVSTEAII